MLEKIFEFKTKQASGLLKKLNITNPRAHLLTQYKDIDQIFNSPVVKIPPFSSFLKAMKKQTFSVDYALKCGVLIHYFLLKCPKQEIASLRNFILYLIRQCKSFGQTIGCIIQTEVQKTATTPVQTDADEVIQGKEQFILKQIISPYLTYLIKATTVLEEPFSNSEDLQNHEVWRLVNLLKTISGFSSKFMQIGRYYFQDFAGLVILLVEVISIDACHYVDQINKYLRKQSKLLSLSSDRAEDRRQVDDFVRLLQQMGWLNEKFSQIFLGKYFFHFLRHIKVPEWLDNNSPQFDTIFLYIK